MCCLVSVGAGDCLGRERQHVPHVHQRRYYLASILVGLVDVAYSLQLEMAPDVDHRDPILRRIFENRLALDHHRDAGHDGGVDGRHALHEQRVARADHVGVSPAAVVRQARPVAAVEHGKVVRRGLLQALERREKLPESEFHRGGGREDSPHRQRPVRGHQALEASRRHKRLLLPRHNLSEDGLSIGIFGEMLPHRIQQCVDRQDQTLLEGTLVERASRECRANILVVAEACPARRERCPRHREDDVLDIVEARVLEKVLVAEVHRLHSRVELGVGSGLGRGRIVGRHRAVRVHDLPRYVLDSVLHENGRIRIRLGHLLLAFLQAVEHVVR
mmetsp:Transcript_48142/g.114562  ORF Transcript_48142/g.114562 Transcript_48142/m.114562 type:complete len:331 (-) Transcript_48142:830-1822(-)